ncbi:hypothetical protein DBL00_22890 [Klebsiella quasipneumoniae]|nr:hypothetical protein DBL00_22890 [Klebsiella quasipneumoniae]
MLAQPGAGGLSAFGRDNDEIGIIVPGGCAYVAYLFLINHLVNGVVNRKWRLRQWINQGKA